MPGLGPQAPSPNKTDTSTRKFRFFARISKKNKERNLHAPTLRASRPPYAQIWRGEGGLDVVNAKSLVAEGVAGMHGKANPGPGGMRTVPPMFKHTSDLSMRANGITSRRAPLTAIEGCFRVTGRAQEFNHGALHQPIRSVLDAFEETKSMKQTSALMIPTRQCRGAVVTFDARANFQESPPRFPCTPDNISGLKDYEHETVHSVDEQSVDLDEYPWYLSMTVGTEPQFYKISPASVRRSLL